MHPKGGTLPFVRWVCRAADVYSAGAAVVRSEGCKENRKDPNTV